MVLGGNQNGLHARTPYGVGGAERRLAAELSPWTWPVAGESVQSYCRADRCRTSSRRVTPRRLVAHRFALPGSRRAWCAAARARHGALGEHAAYRKILRIVAEVGAIVADDRCIAGDEVAIRCQRQRVDFEQLQILLPGDVGQPRGVTGEARGKLARKKFSRSREKFFPASPASPAPRPRSGCAQAWPTARRCRRLQAREEFKPLPRAVDADSSAWATSAARGCPCRAPITVLFSARPPSSRIYVHGRFSANSFVRGLMKKTPKSLTTLHRRRSGGALRHVDQIFVFTLCWRWLEMLTTWCKSPILPNITDNHPIRMG